MVRCMSPAVFLRLVALASAVAGIYSEGSRHKRRPFVLSPSQQLATSKKSPFEGKVLQHESAESGGSGKRTGRPAVVQSADGGKESVSLPTVSEAGDGDDGSRTKKNARPQAAGNVRRSRRAADAEAPAPAPAKTPGINGPLPSAPPPPTSTTITNTVAPTVATKETPAPAVKATPAQPPAGAPAAATPTPTREPQALPPPTMEPTPVPEPPAPTAFQATLPAATSPPAITPTPAKETPAPSSPATPTTPQPAIEPTADTGVAVSPAPKTAEEVSPIPTPESTPAPTAAALGAPVADIDGGANVLGEAGVFGEAADASADEFVVGTGLDSDEKQRIVVGASVIAAVAAVLIMAACLAKKYNARISGLDDDDGGGRPNRLQAKKELPRYRLSSGASMIEINAGN